ncbi:putative metalloprotease CJM1_0395 family protein [Ectothiorhodospira lacustris]|uniref:putative metalloprotease CJM1_0395 family protein n=1 Tax=Ectothiorhodospira lacustris TaxID=2899127 RepID=UPI001EE80737|nr:putative metalloprotease CJM1_0395 family protein [Ectothiorhodospira lacustris]MCG5500584.1 hypothetical protein [Ectothiorhodospira lacustris]MCG5508777.1 hypothetical protein [Ectothiorhodospira lacustris]MCG5520568.1 hypothetical protein [Ectothiorhodospira lacustris]
MYVNNALSAAMVPTGVSTRPDVQRPPEAFDAVEERAGPDGPVEETRDTEEAGTERERPRGVTELTPEEEQMVRELQQRDRDVRAHEQAHVAAGGRYVTSGASYDYQTGPDGRRYAVGGEVSIDTSRPADPQEAIQKARVIFAAAMAPADPSPQDHRVAAQARVMESQARSDARTQRQEEARVAAEAVVEKRRSARDDADDDPMAARDRLARHLAEVDQPSRPPVLLEVA